MYAFNRAVNLGQTYKRAQLSPLFQPAVQSQGSVFHCSGSTIQFVSWPLFQIVGYRFCIDFVSVWYGAVCCKSTGYNCLMFSCSIQVFWNDTLKTKNNRSYFLQKLI